jgi:hypothetical protein
MQNAKLWVVALTMFIGPMRMIHHDPCFATPGQWIPHGPQTDEYLMGETDTLPPGAGPCNVAARKVYRSLEGHDRHYLVGWLPNGVAHVVVLSDHMIYDPLWHRDPVPVDNYAFSGISISEADGWHLVECPGTHGP